MTVADGVDTALRNRIADFLDTSDPEALIPQRPEWSLMGTGFNTLNENPQAQIDTKAYISDATATSIIRGYEAQFPFDTDLIYSEKAVMSLYMIGRDRLQGRRAERNYIRVEIFMDEPPGMPGFKPARRFRVAVEVTNIAGGGAEVIHVTGNLNSVGDHVDGYFNIDTKEFVAKGDTASFHTGGGIID